MISLFLNTASNYLNLVLYKEEKDIDSIYLKLDKDLSKESLPKLKEILDRNNLNPSDIDEIICVRGPGSFTGLRIGVTIAKIYAYFLNKNLYSVSTLDVLATSAKCDIIVPLIDARRGFVYGAIYDKNYDILMKEKYIKLDELINEAEKYNQNIIYVSYDEFSGLNIKKYEPDNINLIKYMHKKIEDKISFIPTYLKRTEAEEKYDKNS